MGALSRLDEFLLNPQVRTCSVAVPGTSGNNNSEKREATRDCSLDDPYLEVGLSSRHSGNLNNPRMKDYPHMVTGATEGICNYPHMVTGIQEKIPYCSPGTSSGKQKKARSTSQPQFRSENTPATFDTDQILLAFQ